MSKISSDKALPNSRETELSILAAILLDPARTIPNCRANLAAKDFYRDSHAKIYECMLKVAERFGGHAVDTTTISNELVKRGWLEMTGGVTFLSTLVDTYALPSNLGEYIEIVKMYANQRRLIFLCNRAIEQVTEGDMALDELLRRMQSEVGKLRFTGGYRGARAVDSVYETLLAEVEHRRNNPDEFSHPKFGIPGLDNLLGGMEPSAQTILAARPGGCKSLLALQAGWNSAKRLNKVTVYFSLEMRAEEHAGRMIANIAGVPGWRIKTGRLDDDQMGYLMRAREEVKKVPLLFRDTSEDVASMRDEIERIEGEYGPVGLAIVDHILLVRGDGAKIYERLTDVSREIKQMLMEKRISGLTLSQLHRQCDEREPMLSDLSNSGALEQDADNVVFLWTPYRDRDLKPRPIDAIVAKQRNGTTGRVPLLFDSEMMFLYDKPDFA